MYKGDSQQPNQNVVEYQYDKQGRRTKEILDDFGLHIETQYIYDNENNLSRMEDPNGNYTWYLYDEANRLTHTINAQGEIAETN